MTTHDRRQHNHRRLQNLHQLFVDPPPGEQAEPDDILELMAVELSFRTARDTFDGDSL